MAANEEVPETPPPAASEEVPETPAPGKSRPREARLATAVMARTFFKCQQAIRRFSLRLLGFVASPQEAPFVCLLMLVLVLVVSASAIFDGESARVLYRLW